MHWVGRRRILTQIVDCANSASSDFFGIVSLHLKPAGTSVIDALVKELRDAYSKAAKGDKVVAIHLFGIRNAKFFDGINVHDIAEQAGIGRSFGTEIRKGVRLAAHVTPK